MCSPIPRSSRRVDADTGRLIGQHIKWRRLAGAYGCLAPVQAFAEALTQDVRTINRDRHLIGNYFPANTGRPTPAELPAVGTRMPIPERRNPNRRPANGRAHLELRIHVSSHS